jgi:hypothetical protein
MQINPNDPAMPYTTTFIYGETNAKFSGLSIRAELAARAMQGIISGQYPLDRLKDIDVVVAASVKFADALISELNKTSQP